LSTFSILSNHASVSGLLIGISNVSTTDLVNFVNNYGLQVSGVGVPAVQQIPPVPAQLGSGASGSNKSAHSGSFRSGFVRVSSPNLQNTRGTKSSLESTPKHCPHSVLQTRVEPKFNTFLMQLLFGGQHLALLLSPPKIVLYTLSQILSSQVSLGKHSLSTQMKLSSQAGLHSPVVVVAASGVVVVASAIVVVASAVVVISAGVGVGAAIVVVASAVVVVASAVVVVASAVVVVASAVVVVASAVVVVASAVVVVASAVVVVASAVVVVASAVVVVASAVVVVSAGVVGKMGSGVVVVPFGGHSSFGSTGHPT